MRSSNGSGPMASTLTVSWPCVTGTPSRLRQSNNCARRTATKSCSCRFIPSTQAPRPEAASTNGAACFAMTCRRRPSRRSTAIPFIWTALVEKIDEALARFPESGCPEIVFSAHSVPVSVIEKGDPYQRQIEETVELVMQRGAWPLRHRLCYQSKVGASKWLQPSLHRTIRDLAAERVREVCVVPIAFVSDHVETLGEIDHEAREEAAALGIQQFEMTSGLNDSPAFIAALAALVKNAIAADRDHAKASAWSQPTKRRPRRGGCPHPPGGAKLRKVLAAESVEHRASEDRFAERRFGNRRFWQSRFDKLGLVTHWRAALARPGPERSRRRASGPTWNHHLRWKRGRN